MRSVVFDEDDDEDDDEDYSEGGELCEDGLYKFIFICRMGWIQVLLIPSHHLLFCSSQLKFPFGRFARDHNALQLEYFSSTFARKDCFPAPTRIITTIWQIFLLLNPWQDFDHARPQSKHAFKRDNSSHSVHPPHPLFPDLGLPPLQSCPAGRKTSLRNTQEFILKRAGSSF